MKKYIIMYLVLFVVLLGLGLTRGIPYGVTVSQQDFTNWFIPGNKKDVLLIYNIIIMMICFVIAFVLTIHKENVLKYKWLIMIVMFVCFMFLPVGMSEEVRGVAQKHTQEFWSLFKLGIRNI